jgi:uncharacterized membrane protein YraQ (UPF0718 family)
MSDAKLHDDALDQALAQALAPPQLPDGFRARLRAALTRVSDADLVTRRKLLEREHREQLQLLKSDSVRLRWRTVGYLVGGAFAAGVGVAIGMPWIRATFGSQSDLVMLLVWVGFGLLVGGISWVRRNGVPHWVP